MLSRRSFSAAAIAMLASPALRGATDTHTLFGRWAGERPTDGYVWQFRYQIEFFSNGKGGPNFGESYPYRYTARQISPKKPFWTITHTGAFSMRQTDSQYWKVILDFRPDPGSQPPPSEDDRTALVDILGLPDNNPRSFRIRDTAGALYFQLTDAPASDGIDRVWYIAPQS